LSHFDDSIDLRSRGEGMFWAAMGILVQVSGFHGELIRATSWCALGFGGILFAFGSPRLFRRDRRLSHRRRLRDRSIGGQARELGDLILQFKRSRDAEEPRFLDPPDVPRLHLRRRAQEGHERSKAIARHRDETVSLYSREHAADVRALVHVLLDREVIGDEEARQLCVVADPKAIESTGLRLIELGERLMRRRLEAA
jgi:hypothetical protein